MPIHVRSVTANDAVVDCSLIPGCFVKVVVLCICHVITLDDVLSPLLLIFGIDPDVSANACLEIATIKALRFCMIQLRSVPTLS